MTTVRFAIAFGLLAGLGACSDMMGNTGSRQAEAVQPAVAPGMVRQVQSKLRDDGYYKQGSVDGVWGSGTEAAVRSFQKDHNLGSSGQLDVPTLQALNLTSAPAQQTDTGRYHSGPDTSAAGAPAAPPGSRDIQPANSGDVPPTH